MPMSRNKEKAQSALNRHYQSKLSETLHVDPYDRPKRVLSVTLLQAAETYRRAIIGEFLAKLSEINNPMIDEAEIRTLNTSLVKLDKEKKAWEHHIVLLGGANHLRLDRRVGIHVNGQWFYGRGRELPEAKKAERLLTKIVPDVVFSHTYYNIREGPIMPEVPKMSSLEKKFTNEDVEKWLIEINRQKLLDEIMGLM